MILTPASLKTLRRKVFKNSMYRFAPTTSSFAPLREPLFHLRLSVWPTTNKRLGLIANGMEDTP